MESINETARRESEADEMRWFDEYVKPRTVELIAAGLDEFDARDQATAEYWENEF